MDLLPEPIVKVEDIFFKTWKDFKEVGFFFIYFVLTCIKISLETQFQKLLDKKNVGSVFWFAIIINTTLCCKRKRVF